jgi:predicted Rossmann-fold nucleotide-binding protein
MKVLVCGGRDFADHRWFSEVMEELWREAGELVVVHGGARGADSLARAFAARHGLPCLVYRAGWDRYGKRAGPLRNQRMLDEAKPDLVVAFPGGRGTADTVARALRAGVPVRMPAR